MSQRDVHLESYQLALERANEFKFCPACRSLLSPRSICDVISYGLVCGNGHRLFVTLERVKSIAHTGEYLSLRSDKNDRDEIAKDWLTNISLRRHLNEQVASILRVILEINHQKIFMDAQTKALQTGCTKYCPKCGDESVVVDGNGYANTFQCSNGHSFSNRGNDLTFRNDPKLPDGDFIAVWFDRCDPWSTIESFINRIEWKKSVAPQVLDILKQFLDEHKRTN